MSAADVEAYARARGIMVKDRSGKHGKGLYGPEGRYLCPLPDHGGGRSLAMGTLRAILEIINQFPSLN